MHRDARIALWMIAAHYAVNAAHGLAHSELAIPLAPWQETFIAAVILAAPAVAFLLVWRGRHSAGGGLLMVSLAGALIFGVWHHFVAVSPDHVSHLPGAVHSGWRFLFQTTAVLLIPTEALGCWAGLRLMRGRASRDGA